MDWDRPHGRSATIVRTDRRAKQLSRAHLGCWLLRQNGFSGLPAGHDARGLAAVLRQTVGPGANSCTSLTPSNWLSIARSSAETVPRRMMRDSLDSDRLTNRAICHCCRPLLRIAAAKIGKPISTPCNNHCSQQTRRYLAAPQAVATRGHLLKAIDLAGGEDSQAEAG